MFLGSAEYSTVAAFLLGYDYCCIRLDLHKGFHGLLLKKLQLKSCALGWPPLALRLLLGYIPENSERTFPGREKELIQGLGELILEYLDEKEAQES
jgi:hypothetical protein